MRYSNERIQLGGAGGSTDDANTVARKTVTVLDAIMQGLHRADYVNFFDDFDGDVIGDQYAAVLGSGGAAAAAISAAKGGVLLLTSDDSAGTVAADAAEIVRELNWFAENDELVMEARVKLSSIAAVGAFVGFTDTKSLEAAFVSAGSANTITSNASDAVGFMFDTSMTADNWWACGVDTDVDAVHEDTGEAPVADTYQKLTVRVSSAGAGSFYINDTLVAGPIAGCVTPGTALTPSILVVPKAAAAVKTMSVDYLALSMKRA